MKKTKNNSNQKNNKTIFFIIGLILILFLIINAYAKSQGYSNIYKMISKVETKSEVDEKNSTDIKKENSSSDEQNIPLGELKYTLNYFAKLNLYDNSNNADNYLSKEAFQNQILIENAIDGILLKEGSIRKSGYPVEEVYEIVTEICGRKLTEPVNTLYSIISYDSDKNCYILDAGDGTSTAVALELKDISYNNGIYSVDFVYCFASENDLLENRYDDLDKYRTTMSFKINNNYKISKYCLINLDTLASEPYTEKVNYNLTEEFDINSTSFQEKKDTDIDIEGITKKAEKTYNKYLELSNYIDEFTPGMKNLLPTLGLKIGKLEKTSIKNGNLTYFKTDVPFEKFENELLKYVSKDFYNTHYKPYYLDLSGYVGVTDCAIGTIKMDLKNITFDSVENGKYYFNAVLVDTEMYNHYLRPEPGETPLMESDCIVTESVTFVEENGNLVICDN